MMRQIVPCRLTIMKMQSPFEFSLNKTEDIRLYAANVMAQRELVIETAVLAACIRD
jgi:transcriptional regulator